MFTALRPVGATKVKDWGMSRPKGSEKTPGSGRKLGQGTHKRNSVDVVKEWRESGQPVPLMVMLRAMQEELEDAENIRHRRQNRRAFPYANAAAVYFHAKPTATIGIHVNPNEAAQEIMAALREVEDTTSPPKEK